MTKQEMIEAIYDKIADKEWNIGLKIEYNGKIYGYIPTYKDDNYKKFSAIKGENDVIELKVIFNIETGKEEFNGAKIIGHPILIGDMLDYLEKEKQLHPTGLFFKELSLEIIKVWKDKRKSIDEQSEETITYIFDLINN